VVEDVVFHTPRGKFQLEVYDTCLAFRSQAKVNKGEAPEGYGKFPITMNSLSSFRMEESISKSF
jgi:hypothetical protein